MYYTSAHACVRVANKVSFMSSDIAQDYCMLLGAHELWARRTMCKSVFL